MTFPLMYRKFIRGFNDHIKAGLEGATDYVANYEPVYAPFGGKCYLFGSLTDKGGYWIGIKRSNGEKVEMAHFSTRNVSEGQIVKEGEFIGTSGNSGTETTGAHLHVQWFGVDGKRVDVDTMVFFAKSLAVIAVNADITYLKSLQAEILKYSAGMLTITWDTINHPIQIETGMLDQTMAYILADQLYDPKYLPYRYLFLFYPGNATSSFLATYYYPGKNCCISSLPQPTISRLNCFEFSHQIQLYYNEHRGMNPQVEVVDSNFPTDELITKKLRSVLPYIQILGGGQSR